MSLCVATYDNNFVYKVRRDIYKVKVNDIVYLESTKRIVTLYLADGSQKEFYGKLRDVFYEQLQKFDFLLIHASFAINFDYIWGLKNDSIALNHSCKNVFLPISRQRKKEVRTHYLSIMKKRGMFE